MPVEEQIQHNTYMGLSGQTGGKKWAGQRILTFPNRKIAKLAFLISKLGNPTGEVTFIIREYPTDIVLLSKVWGDASDLPAAYPPTEWQEVEFDTPQLIDVLVEMIVKFSGGDGGNQVAFALQGGGSVKPDEEYVRDVEGVEPTSDATYRYTYIVPPTVTTDPATSVEAIGATLNGTLVADGGEACDCGFEYGETGDYGTTTPTQSRTTGQTFSQAITGLDPNKTYHFRAFATNAEGTSYGADRTFSTPIGLPAVTTDPATIVATVNGTLNQDGGEACECRFEWGETVAYGNTTPPQSKVTGETFSQALTGLIPDTTYHFRALATNAAGTGDGDDRTFTTAPAVGGLNPAALLELLD